MSETCSGQIVLVTGGAAGIGRATAQLFAARGSTVVVVDVAVEEGQRTVELIEQSGGTATFLRSDVSVADDVEAMVKETVARYGRLDVAFNNAGTECEMAAISEATEEDWKTEYLDKIISVKIVDGVNEAIKHINNYSSGHTESIITKNAETFENFYNKINSAIILQNASTQFADGGEFGFGAEIGISTDKLHVRGPVGSEHLTSFKYVVRGSGQVRP